jgi:hypothetical protein
VLCTQHKSEIVLRLHHVDDVILGGASQVGQFDRFQADELKAPNGAAVMAASIAIDVARGHASHGPTGPRLQFRSDACFQAIWTQAFIHDVGSEYQRARKRTICGSVSLFRTVSI